MCLAPRQPPLFEHLNVQNYSDAEVFCTCWLGNVLRAAMACTFATSQRQIKRPDNPTSQLRPIMSNKCCSGDREGRKDKGGGGGSRSKTSCMWRIVCGKVPRKTKVDVTKCHACHAKRRWMSPTCHAKWRGATGAPARPSAPPEPAQCPKCHACHAKRRWTSLDVTKCPRLPRKVARRPGRRSAPKRATRASPVLQVPRLPRETKVDVTKPHLPCEMKVDVTKCHACHAKLCVKDGVWQSWVWKMVCDKVCVWKMVCDKVVCERVSVKDVVWQSCLWKMVCNKVVCEKRCDKVVCESWCVKKLCVKIVTKCQEGGRHQVMPATRNQGGCHQNEGGCYQVPHLPRETKVDVTKCHACHAKWRGATGDPARPSAPPEPAQRSKCHACFHTQRCHTFLRTQLSHTIFNTQLCVAGVALGDIHLRFTW